MILSICGHIKYWAVHKNIKAPNSMEADHHAEKSHCGDRHWAVPAGDCRSLFSECVPNENALTEHLMLLPQQIVWDFLFIDRGHFLDDPLGLLGPALSQQPPGRLWNPPGQMRQREQSESQETDKLDR